MDNIVNESVENPTHTPAADDCELWDGTRYAFTLRKISRITGIEIPEEFVRDMDTPIAEVKANKLYHELKPGDVGLRVLFIYLFKEEEIEFYKDCINKGVILVSHVSLKDENGAPYPMIVLEDQMKVRSAFCAIGKYIKGIFPLPTIGITGSVGKTTLTRFLECIFAERYNVFSSGGNRNSPDTYTNQIIERYGQEHTFHIQECGAGGPGTVRRSADLLSVDAFCVTNILPVHLDSYKSLDAILKDKTSFDRVEGKECFGVINIDDDKLRDHKFNNRIVTCGIKHTEADYVAKNIRQNGLYLEMDITCKGSHTVPIKINIPGLHNANGAVMAFAMAKEWGVTDEEIQNRFLKYKSDPIRQNLTEVSGRLIYVDCFNIAAESIYSSLETLGSIKIKEGNRRIAVLGGQSGLGSKFYSVNYELGLNLRNYQIDEFIIIGVPHPATNEQLKSFGHGRALYEGIRASLRNKVKVSYFTSDQFGDVADKLVRETKPGDVILLKGIYRLSLTTIIDRAFGTSFAVYAPRVYPVKLFAENGFSVTYFETDGEFCNIRLGKVQSGILKIPNMIADHPVFRVGNSVFRNNPLIKEIDFGLSCANIGIRCFQGCVNIKSLELPRNILHIEADAFADCTSLESVVIQGTEHIEAGAFRNCRNLRTVTLPETVCTIEKDVFAGCPDITVIAPKNSFAAAYAKNNGLKLIEA